MVFGMEILEVVALLVILYEILKLALALFAGEVISQEEIIATMRKLRNRSTMDLLEDQYTQAPESVRIIVQGGETALRLLGKLDLPGIDGVVDEAHEIVIDIMEDENEVITASVVNIDTPDNI